MKLLAPFVLAVALAAQTQPLRPLHVSPAGIILDDTGTPVILTGLNRSATGSGNADATATDQEYAAQNQLLEMNLVRIFVNAAWWNANLQVPIAGIAYQTYIDNLIQRAKKYGNYVLVLKAGQFPDPPCGTDGKSCPAPNQGDLNCKANSTVCLAQDTSGNSIDAALAFWTTFSRKYASDAAVLYDTWEDMHGIDTDTWSNNQNELIATIRTYNPKALIFVEDMPGVFESIVSGAYPDLAWANIVWSFHVFAASSGACTQTASPRYAGWPQNLDPLVSYAHQNGHAAAITEWGGCNDSEPYHTDITSYAKAHSVTLAYFDSSNLLALSGSAWQLTATGSKVAQAYTAIVKGGAGPVTNLSSASQASALAPEALAVAIGSGLAVATLSSTTQPPGTTLAGTGVQLKDAAGVSRPAELLFISPTRLVYQVPPGSAAGSASVTVTVNSQTVASGPAQIAGVAPGLYAAGGNGLGAAAATVTTTHSSGPRGFAYTFACTGPGNCTAVPIDLGLDTDEVKLQLFGTGIRGHTGPVTCKIGTVTVPVASAGPQGSAAGLDEVDLVLPKTLRGAGIVTVILTVDGQSSNPVSLSFK